MRRSVVAAALCVLAALLALLPLLSTSVLPLLDVNSHETRLFVLRNLLVTGTGSRFYALDTLLLPNLGFDVPGLLLACCTDVATAGRIFFALVLLLTLSGVAALGRILFGRWSPVRLAAVLPLYSLYAMLGFLGYALGIALVFWGLAARLWLDRCPAWQRLLLGSLLGVMLLFCHVAAFATYAVVLGGVAADALVRRRIAVRRLVLTGLEGVPAAVLFLLMEGGHGSGFQYHHPVWRAKLSGLVASLTSGDLPADLATAAGLLVFVLLVLAVAATGGRVRVARPLVPGILALAVLFVLVPPNVGTGAYVDERIPAVALLLGIAGLELEVRSWRPAVLVLAGCFGVACVAKQARLAAVWRDTAAPLVAVTAMVDRLPENAVILQWECPARQPGLLGAYAGRLPPLSHAVAVAGHDGRRFVPVTWTIKGQQPIRVRPEYLPYKMLQDRFNAPVCTADAADAMLSAARELLANQVRSGGLVAPLFLNLVRFPATVPLSVPRLDGTPDMVLFAVPPP